jgi:hypothetical protein
MKTLLIGLLALESVTAFATEVAKSVSLQTSFDEVITFELQ